MLVAFALQRSRNRKVRRVGGVLGGWASPLLTFGIYDTVTRFARRRGTR